MCPEFIRALDEPQVVLELPSSIVVSYKWQKQQHQLSLILLSITSVFFFYLLSVKKGKVSKQSERAECADAKWSEHSG